jgi:hypothetical protein
MPCNNFEMWNPVPPGSQVCAKITKTGDDFVASVRVVPDIGPGMKIGTGALLAGKCVPLVADRGYGVSGLVSIGHEAPSVTLTITLKGPDGTVLKECDWTFSKADTKFDVMIALVPA